MNVSLSPQLEALVRRKIETGPYNNATEVVQEALKVLDERDRAAQLKAALAVGEEQFRRGDTIPFTPELVEEMKREAERMAQEGVEPDPDVCP
jgi:antitoxin ParD1/3/4